MSLILFWLGLKYREISIVYWTKSLDYCYTPNKQSSQCKSRDNSNSISSL